MGEFRPKKKSHTRLKMKTFPAGRREGRRVNKVCQTAVSRLGVQLNSRCTPHDARHTDKQMLYVLVSGDWGTGLRLTVNRDTARSLGSSFGDSKSVKPQTTSVLHRHGSSLGL